MDERAQCLMEEVKEFMEAIAVEDMAGMADALVDLVYFAKGTAAILGLPWRALFEDVHRANMAKVRGVGKRGFAVDLIKPEGWEGPKTMEILKHFGYEEKK
jgi:predicted HAD superfamily Cof-like phosphohydrolase